MQEGRRTIHTAFQGTKCPLTQWSVPKFGCYWAIERFLGGEGGGRHGEKSAMPLEDMGERCGDNLELSARRGELIF